MFSAVSFFHVPQHNITQSPHSALLMVRLMRGCFISLLRLSQVLLGHTVGLLTRWHMKQESYFSMLTP